jgi:hypothetical protein
MTIVMRRATAALLTAHAIAHLAGFAWPWWVLEPLPTPPDNAALVGDAVMQATSVGWLAIAIAFMVAALALLGGSAHWRHITAAAATLSLVLSVICWPGSLLGVPINLAILATLHWTRPSRWTGPPPWAHA